MLQSSRALFNPQLLEETMETVKKPGYSIDTAQSAFDLCFRYAWPCAGKRLDSGKIDEDTYNTLMTVFSGRLSPDEAILRKAFPNMCAAIETRAQRLGIGAWTLENVAPYWLTEHRHEESPVILGTVLRDNGEQFWRVWGIGAPKTVHLAHNLYGLPIKPDDTVSIHNDTIIEPVDPRTLACYATLGFGI